MTSTGSNARPTSRAKQFFQGLFLPLLLWAVVFSAFPLPALLVGRILFGVFPVLQAATLAVLAGSAFLLFRWWGPARWRAYGVLTGLLTLPLVLAGALAIAVLKFGLQLGPR
jgi:hypothetical protein